MSGKKIAFIGAGSYGFTFKLVADILSFDVLMDSEFAFMDVDQGRLDNLRILLTEYFKKVGYGKKPIYTLNMQEALEGANFVKPCKDRIFGSFDDGYGCTKKIRIISDYWGYLRNWGRLPRTTHHDI